ncbi:hypothetical protein FBQ81_15125 [Chloroflexi bacterium CFX6]|nr:hypothetical protein [Chloroflexi bacterium CFX6]
MTEGEKSNMSTPVNKPRENGTVIILGAGASFGSKIISPPPIMKNFIKVGLELVQHDYTRLWEFLESIGYSLVDLKKGEPNIEVLYSILQNVSSGLWYTNKWELFSDIGDKFWKILPDEYLESFIIEVTNYSSVQALNKPCEYHKKLVDGLVDGDTIISFNYDIIVDIALSESGKWFEVYGYGFPDGFLLEDNEPYPLDAISKITLLKPHGSLNWILGYPPDVPNPSSDFRKEIFGKRAEKSPTIQIIPIENCKEDQKSFYGPLMASFVPYAEERDPTLVNNMDLFGGMWRDRYDRAYLIPPGANKFGDPSIPPEIISTWSHIRKALMMAGKIVCIGYSFPLNDYDFSSLFRITMAKNKNLQSIQVINPDSSIQEKIKGLSQKANVEYVCNTLEEYVLG